MRVRFEGRDAGAEKRLRWSSGVGWHGWDRLGWYGWFRLGRERCQVYFLLPTAGQLAPVARYVYKYTRVISTYGIPAEHDGA